MNTVTIERIERAIRTVARMMVLHNLDLRATVEYLEAERTKLTNAVSAAEYGRRILEQRTQQRTQHGPENRT